MFSFKPQFALSVLCVAFAASAAFDKNGNPKPLKLEMPSIEKRREMIKPVAQGEVRARPTFNGCSIVWGADETPGARLEYRRSGADDWNAAPPLPWFGNVRNYRGSILDLEEDTGYEFRIAADGRTLASGRFRT